jgi:hypothetical protein
MTCEITDLSESPAPDPLLMPARRYAAGLREIGEKSPAGASMDGRSLEAGAYYIDRLADEVVRLRADRAEYAGVALAGLAGIVGIPEAGYLVDGGPGLLASDLAGLRREVGRLRAEGDRLRAALASIAAFAPDEGSAIDPSTQIATFAKQVARGALGGGGES